MPDECKMPEISQGRIAIIGAAGLLGHELVRKGESLNLPIVRCAYSTQDLKNYAIVDITNIDSLNFFFDTWKPDVVINCAAYTRVDDAEVSYDSCFNLNVIGVENLAKSCSDRGMYLVHISSDYVFGGVGHQQRERVPFKENEFCSPCGVYGWSKYFGERQVINILPNQSLIVRTSWLHGTTGPNFIKTILKVAIDKGQLKVVNDQFGALTWAPWLAESIYSLIEKKITGIIHACASDTLTWYDVAEKVLNKTKVLCELNASSTEEFARPAPRPKYSKLDTSALAKILGKESPTNEEFIDLYIQQALT